VQLAADKAIADRADVAALAAKGSAQEGTTAVTAQEAHAQQAADSAVVVKP
jgi:hypothetical protein